jgi:hypothetical protein
MKASEDTLCHTIVDTCKNVSYLNYLRSQVPVYLAKMAHRELYRNPQKLSWRHSK